MARRAIRPARERCQLGGPRRRPVARFVLDLVLASLVTSLFFG